MNKIVLPNEIMLGEVSRMLAEGKEVVIMTKGFSMLPFIKGDYDSVVLARKERFRPGEIALGEISKGVYVLHRIRKVLPGGIIMKGDGNLRGTESCRNANVCGIVKEIQKASGRKVNPDSPVNRFLWRCWVAMPTIGRRFILHYVRKQL